MQLGSDQTRNFLQPTSLQKIFVLKEQVALCCSDVGGMEQEYGLSNLRRYDNLSSVGYKWIISFEKVFWIFVCTSLYLIHVNTQETTSGVFYICSKSTFLLQKRNENQKQKMMKMNRLMCCISLSEN